RVLMVSTFQHPFYPGSGVEGRSERMVNVPLPAGAGSAEFRAAVTEEWLPALERFAPQMLFVSAGFDAHRDDGMAMLCLREPDYAWVTQQVRTVAARHAEGRIVSMLEGGYTTWACSAAASPRTSSSSRADPQDRALLAPVLPWKVNPSCAQTRLIDSLPGRISATMRSMPQSRPTSKSRVSIDRPSPRPCQASLTRSANSASRVPRSRVRRATATISGAPPSSSADRSATSAISRS